MSRPYTVRPPVRKPIDFQNVAAVAFVGVTSRSIRSTRIAFASSRRRVARARPTPFRRHPGSTKKSFTIRSRPSSAEGEYTASATPTTVFFSRATGIDRTSDVRIVAVPRIDMNMEMGDRVPVEFVVHLDWREEVCNAFRDEHHVVPEGVARGRGQFEWFDDVLPRDDRDVTGERGLTRGGDPRRREGRDNIPRVPASTDRASRATSTKGPGLRGPPQRPSEWFGHLCHLKQRHANGLARLKPFDIGGNLDVPVRLGHRRDRPALLERGKGLPVDDSDRVELETPGRPVDPLAERDADDLRLSGRQTSHPSQHRGE